MPYGIRKQDGKYCVYNTDTGNNVPSGCYDVKKDALNRQRAMMVNVPDAQSASADRPALVTVPNVPIVSTGTYQLAGNPYGHETTFTTDDLEAAVAAADDPAVLSPRLKLGHEFEWADGEPAFGKIDNLRVGNNGQTLYGDLVGVPAWLADILPTAYPNRSIEASFQATTPTGRTHRMLITAVSLLGVVMPGVATLDDLKDWYSEEQPDDVVLEAGALVEAAIGGVQEMRWKRSARGSVSLEDVRRTWYEQLGPDQTWWWIRAVYLDPNELIVDDDEGGLYRVSFEVNGEEVTFGDPVEVKIQYVNAAKVAAAAAEFDSRSESRPESNDKEERMDPKEVRQLLGLPEDASDDQVREALKTRDESQPETPGEEPESPEQPGTTEEPGEGTEEPGETEQPQAQVPAAASTSQVDAETLEQLKRDAAAGRQAHERQVADERNRLLDDAIKAGKFPPSRRDHYGALMAADPDGTKELIAKLEPGIVPVDEQGTASSGDLSEESYPAEWLPEVRARNQNGSERVIEEKV